MNQTFYYRVAPTSPVMAVIGHACAERAAQYVATQDFKDKHGAKYVVGKGVNPVGATFEGVVPGKGWRWSEKERFFMPNRSSKEGRKLIEELDAIPKVCNGLGFSERLSEATGQEFLEYQDTQIRWAGYGVFGDIVLLTTPVAVTVDGLTEITKTEFQEIFDEHQEKVKGAVAA